jgi:hypothetical protein
MRCVLDRIDLAKCWRVNVYAPSDERATRGSGGLRLTVGANSSRSSVGRLEHSPSRKSARRWEPLRKRRNSKWLTSAAIVPVGSVIKKSLTTTST